MAVFCCFSNRFSKTSDIHNSANGYGSIMDKASFSPTTITCDLLSDEGADYQRELWHLALSQNRQAMLNAIDRIKNTPAVTSTVVLGLSANEPPSAESCLQALTVLYNQNNLTQRMPRIRQVFASLEPFAAAVASMAQTNMVPALVWGCLTMVFQSILRFGSIWDDVRTMLEDLARRLPRFRAYFQVLHTPRLHSSLRDVYQMFLEFCLKVFTCLEGNQCYALIRIQWSSFSADLRSSIDRLAITNDEFEKEVRLADVQEQAKRHKEVMTVLLPRSLVTNINLPRNKNFIGRDSILALLHSVLEPSLKRDMGDPAACSCLIHAIGGMGKTETALEYTYRFRHHYAYVFWLRSQTEQLLLDSILEVVSILGLVKEEGLAVSKKVQICLQWFQSIDKPWLLVFDNAEDIATIQLLWPACTCGAIIVTSQNPILGLTTKDKIHLQPMSVDEGSSLIQNILQRGSSEQEDAQLLSEHLGGLPLAIAHFAGAILKSQCPINQISRSFLQRVQSSRVWTIEDDTSTARAYQSTLNTVWDIAINRLSADSTRLLAFIAFIDPDQIPVDLFIGKVQGEAEHDSMGWKYWDVERFNDAVVGLCERHLVERYQNGSVDVLKTHRALQRSILQRLDKDIIKRDDIFKEVVSIVRKSLPAADLVKRGDESQLLPYTKYSPQAICLHKNFTQSEPKIPGSLAFANILQDTAFYGLHGLGQLSTPLSLLQTAESICTSLMDSNPGEARDMLVHVLSSMGPVYQELSREGRATCLELVSRVIKLLEEGTEGISPDQWTEEQAFLFARAHHDYGWYLTQANRFEEAEIWFEKSIAYFRSVDNELLLALAICDRLWLLSVQQRKQQTRKEAASSLATIVEEYGENNPLTLIMKFTAAGALLTIGDLDEALAMFQDVYERRTVVLGSTHHQTLASRYCISVCLQYKKDLEGAETILREILSIGCLNDGWRPEDVTRVKFRLWIVLRLQNRLVEAGKIRADVDQVLRELRPSGSHVEYTNEDYMALLDLNVTINHGRTAGIFSNRSDGALRARLA